MDHEIAYHQPIHNPLHFGGDGRQSRGDSSSAFLPVAIANISGRAYGTFFEPLAHLLPQLDQSRCPAT